MILIKHLPSEIRELVIIRHQQYQSTLSHGITTVDINDRLSSLFDFSESEEGHEFWQNIAKGDFNVYYEKYGRTILELTSCIPYTHPYTYKGSFKGKKVKITIEYED